MNGQELKKNELVQEWIKTRRAKPNTIKNYIGAMAVYTEVHNMTPEELLEEAEQEILNRVLPRKQRIKTRLIEFQDRLEHAGIAPLTVKSRLIAIRSFYKAFDIPIPSMTRADRVAEPLKEHKRIPTREEIRSVLKLCDPPEKAILLVGLSSGLAVNEITNLKIADFKKGYDKTDHITTLKLRREKTNNDFVTFLTPEASDAVNEYMRYRNRKPKTDQNKSIREKQLAKQRIYTDDGYLFIVRKVPDEFLESKDEELRKMSRNTVMAMYRSLAEDSSNTVKPGVWSYLRSHNARKVFNSTLKNKGMEQDLIEYLMGHKIESTRAAYWFADPAELKEQFKKYIPYLTISKMVDVVGSHEYKKLKDDYETIKAEKETLVIENTEIQKLREELDQLRNEKEAEIEGMLIINEEALIEKVLQKVRGNASHGKEQWST